MKTKRLLAIGFALTGLVALIGAKAGGQDMLKRGVEAKAFTAKATDGKSYALKDLIRQGDVFLYFISDTCPVNAAAVKYYERLFKAYGEKANFVGVINGNAKAFAAWNKTHNTTFKSLFDPDLKIIDSYKAIASPWIVQVGANGKVARVWTGYSMPELEQLNVAMATALKTKVKKVDFSGAPKEMRYG